MTREEAIKWLVDKKYEYVAQQPGTNTEAYDMAIEALSICGNFICAERFRQEMYHQAFEVEPEGMVRWDSGLWIRYKLFENTLDSILEENKK